MSLDLHSKSHNLHSKFPGSWKQSKLQILLARKGKLNLQLPHQSNFMRLWMMKLNESPSKQAFMFLLLNWEIDQQQAENHKRIRKRRFMSRRHNQIRRRRFMSRIHNQIRSRRFTTRRHCKSGAF